jgi:hypothetical protein
MNLPSILFHENHFKVKSVNNIIFLGSRRSSQNIPIWLQVGVDSYARPGQSRRCASTLYAALYEPTGNSAAKDRFTLVE